MKGLVWAVCLFGVARSGPARGDFRQTAAEARSPTKQISRGGPHDRTRAHLLHCG